MKTNKIITTVLIFIGVLSGSCSFEEEPKYSLNDQTVFESEETANLAINGIYNSMASANLYGQFLIEFTEATSGIGFARDTGSPAWIGQCANLNIPATAHALRDPIWSASYSSIGNMNIFLKNINNSTSLTDAYKNNSIGQVKTLRAFVYLNLVELFGGVPLKLEATDLYNINTPKATKAEIYDAIVKDLLDAISLLKNNNSTAQIKDYTAQAILAKVYFLLASAEDQNTGTKSKYWAMAKVQGDLAMTHYSLEPNLTTLFSGALSPTETILKLNFLDTQTANVLGLSFAPAGMFPAPATFGRTRCSKTLYDEHVKKYPGDPRINVSYVYNSFTNFAPPNAVVKVYPAVGYTQAQGWPYFKKHAHASRSSIDFALYRFADLKLLMAEVENELGNQTAALKHVNDVLTRARNAVPGATQPANWTATSKEDFRWNIFLERQYEFVGEGLSFYEVRRRGLEYFKKILARHNNNANRVLVKQAQGYNDVTYDLSLAERNLLLPIPLAEINSNTGMTTADQNPGY